MLAAQAATTRTTSKILLARVKSGYMLETPIEPAYRNSSLKKQAEWFE